MKKDIYTQERGLVSVLEELAVEKVRERPLGVRLPLFDQKNAKIQNRTHGRSSPVNNGAEEDSPDNISTPTSGFQGPQSGHAEKHICWICQEEMSSEALLLEHYENHMKY